MTAPLFRTAGLAISALAVLAPAAPAFASDENRRSVTVSYEDLNLLSDKGVARLNTRIESAADSVCGTRGLRAVRERQMAQACKTATLFRASRDVEFAIAAQRGDSQLASTSASIGVSAR